MGYHSQPQREVSTTHRGLLVYKINTATFSTTTHLSQTQDHLTGISPRREPLVGLAVIVAVMILKVGCRKLRRIFVAKCR